jgi:hypothetical protein
LKCKVKMWVCKPVTYAESFSCGTGQCRNTLEEMKYQFMPSNICLRVLREKHEMQVRMVNNELASLMACHSLA